MLSDPAPSPLPEDTTALQALVAGLSAQLAARDRIIKVLKAQLAALRRRHFGQRSERLADQLELQIEQMEQILERTAAPTGQPVRPVRKPLPASLPREEEVLAPPYALCPGCGVELRRIGEDVSEVLEIVPARLRVRRYVRPVMACRCCGDISQAAPPPLPIPKSNAAPSLLADIALAKYDDHLPAYRQAERFARGRRAAALDPERVARPHRGAAGAADRRRRSPRVPGRQGAGGQGRPGPDRPALIFPRSGGHHC